MKSILLHVQDDPSLDRRLDAALALARARGGHLGCLHVTPVEAYVAMDSFGGVFVMQEMLTAIDAQENVLRKRVEDRLSREEIGWDYEQVTGSVANVIISRAALNDVVVAGRERHSRSLDGAALALLGDLLHRSRTPLLVPGKNGRPYDPTGPALIGWDGSYEAANAVRGALGLLRLSSDVRIVRVEESSDELFPSTRLLEYLSRYGVHAELELESGERQWAGPLLIEYALESGVETLVIGGYSHSRIGEYLFGGVTRNLLTVCPVALFVAH
jgi:nucleotide-binding universal stress UspA family protein